MGRQLATWATRFGVKRPGTSPALLAAALCDPGSSVKISSFRSLICLAQGREEDHMREGPPKAVVLVWGPRAGMGMGRVSYSRLF